MHSVIAIMGGRNSGKSTIIKSLTGCQFSRTRGYVRDNAKGRSIYVIANSPQEKEMSLPELRSILNAVRRQNDCNGVVCALQPSKPRRRLRFEKVLSEAIAAGFNVFPYVLDPPRDGVRTDLRAVKARLPQGTRRLRILDARSFAHLNAVAINGHTRIAGEQGG